MATRYRDLEDNSEVVDVLFSIIQGYDTPQAIGRILKQDNSTYRSKLLFLRKWKVVIKDKWKYAPDYDGLYRVMLKALSLVLNDYDKIRKGSTRKIRSNPKAYFPKELIVSILKSYSFLFSKGFPKLSLKDLMRSFLDQLTRADLQQVRKINPKLLEVRKEIEKQHIDWFFS